MKRYGLYNIGWVESRQRKNHLNLSLLSSWQLVLLKEDLGLKWSLTSSGSFLLTPMKLGLVLLTIDLGFRFHVLASIVSSIFITWIKLMSRLKGTVSLNCVAKLTAGQEDSSILFQKDMSQSQMHYWLLWMLHRNSKWTWFGSHSMEWIL